MKPISMEHAFLYLNWALVKVGHHFPEGLHFSILFVIKIFIYHSQKVMFPRNSIPVPVLWKLWVI